MMVNRHKYFRWNGRTARITFAYVVAFPALIGYLAYTTDVSAKPNRIRVNELTSAGQMGFEGQATGQYDCGVLDGGRKDAGGFAIVYMPGNGMPKPYR